MVTSDEKRSDDSVVNRNLRYSLRTVILAHGHVYTKLIKESDSVWCSVCSLCFAVTDILAREVQS